MPAQHVQATSLDRDKACALTASTAEPPEDDEGGQTTLPLHSLPRDSGSRQPGSNADHSHVADVDL